MSLSNSPNISSLNELKPPPSFEAASGSGADGCSGFPGGPEGFDGAPEGFDGGPDDFDGGPEGFDGGPDDFDGGPEGFFGGLDDFDGGPDDFDGGPEGFFGGLDDFDGGPEASPPEADAGVAACAVVFAVCCGFFPLNSENSVDAACVFAESLGLATCFEDELTVCAGNSFSAFFKSFSALFKDFMNSSILSTVSWSSSLRFVNPFLKNSITCLVFSVDIFGLIKR